MQPGDGSMPAPSTIDARRIDDEAGLFVDLVRGARAQAGLAAIAVLDDAGDELGQEQRRRRLGQRRRARIAAERDRRAQALRARARGPVGGAREDRDDDRVLAVRPHDRVARVRRATAMPSPRAVAQAQPADREEAALADALVGVDDELDDVASSGSLRARSAGAARGVAAGSAPEPARARRPEPARRSAADRARHATSPRTA